MALKKSKNKLIRIILKIELRRDGFTFFRPDKLLILK